MIEEDRLDPEETDGVRGNDLDENLFNPVVKLFRKFFGGGLGASLRAPDDSLLMSMLLPSSFTLTSVPGGNPSPDDGGDDARL
ncbi:hypothetical protein AGABI2DRAFT_191718, partial [Agaricus bisporus var. bisporus H97]|uniref:hypothetical protein n=1 Tax=Agaricus bisporus var. bisporus (strain H97 / ATCC MYA-4626 / FGSC 10389) TaxID=936046 RepID=UPI00029F5690